jgi:hypothetical protein
MNRRHLLLGAAAGAASLAGCASGGFDPTNTMSTQKNAVHGGLIAEDIDTAPTDATIIDGSTGRVASVDAIQTILEEAATDDEGHALLPLDPGSFDAALDMLTDLPLHTRTDGAIGYYFRYDGSLFLVYPFYREAPR